MSNRTRCHRVVATIVGATMALSACRDEPTQTLVAKRSALPDSADQVMFGLRLELTTKGVRKGQLRADTAFFFDQGTRIELRKPNTVFFDASGVQNATMTAREGTFNTRSNTLDGRGDVVVTSTDGRRLTSPHLLYDRAINQISSDTTFRFTAPGRELSGIGFTSDPQLRSVVVNRAARGRTVLPAGGLGGARP